MGHPLRVLIVEDSEDDAILMVRELRRSGFDPQWKRLDTGEAMEEAIRTGGWDVVLSDYRMPRFDGPGALEVLRRSGFDLPFILVSGAIGDEEAAAAMRGGAHDFVSKTNLARLGPAVDRELGEAEVRRARLHAERALRESEERYRSLMANLPVGVFRSDAAGRIASANPALVTMLGFETADQVLGVSTPDLYADPERQRELEERLARDRIVVDFEARIRRLDGSVFWGLLNVRAVSDDDGAILYHDGTLADVSRRRELELALVRGKEEWERTFDAVRELIMISDEEYRVLRLNRALATRLGAEPQEIVGRPGFEILHGSELVPDEPAFSKLTASGRPAEFHVHSERLGGDFHFSMTPRFDDGGRFIGAVFVGRDVTAQRQLEEVLRRQSMVEQAEQILRTFRHEVGNALNTLKTTLTVLRSSYQVFSAEQRETYFNRCADSFRIAERLLHALRAYQTLEEVHLRPLDLVEFLGDKAGLLLENARDRGVRCGCVCAAGSLRISGDPDALVRVLLNLVDNAIAATADQSEPRIEIMAQATPSLAIIRVSDNGPGIPEHDLAQVFAPLFTTRSDGSGMGLAIVQKLMVKMGGLAVIDSRPGRECTVELRLPLTS